MVALAVPQYTEPVVIRNVVAQLKAQRFKLRDLDVPNGQDAIAAIVATMTHRQLIADAGSLGLTWELVASRALQFVNIDRQSSKRPSRQWMPFPGSTDPTDPTAP